MSTEPGGDNLIPRTSHRAYVGPLKKKRPSSRDGRARKITVSDRSISGDELRAKRATSLPWQVSGREVMCAGGQVLGRFERPADAVWAAMAASHYVGALPELQRGRCLIRALEANLDPTGKEIDRVLLDIPSTIWRKWLRKLGWRKQGPGANWYPRGEISGPTHVEDRGADDHMSCEELTDVAEIAGRHRAHLLADMLLAAVREHTLVGDVSNAEDCDAEDCSAQACDAE
jgi:hypothetical protein